MESRMYWTPGTVITKENGFPHSVVVSLFTGAGHAGVIRSQCNGETHYVWDVDIYGGLTLHTQTDDVGEARTAFRNRVAEYLAPETDDE